MRAVLLDSSWRPLTRRPGTDDLDPSASRWRRWITAAVTGLLLVAGISLVIEVLEDHAPVLALGVLYLLAVVPVAVLWGMTSATAVSVLSILAFSYLFVPPRRQLSLSESGNWIVLVVFVLTAVVVSELAARSQRSARASARLAAEQGALRRVATLVARETSREQLDALISAEAGKLLGADLAVLRHYRDDGSIQEMGHWARSGRLPQDLPAVARVTELIARTGAPQRVEGRPSGNATVGSAVGAPITVEGRLWGAMIVASGLRALPPNTGARLADFTALAAIAIANAKNRADLAASRERVVVAADQARRRIERDLHDGAQQQLVALAIDLQALAETVPAELRADLGQVAQGLVGTLDELREIARGIHPAILVQGGLGPALRMLARRCPVPVEVELEVTTRLAEQVEIATYYVVAEALTNAAKHADASVVRVTGAARGGVLRVSVADDGRGGANFAQGSGLIGITDRVEALGGTLVLRSPLGAGTTVELTLPLTVPA